MEKCDLGPRIRYEGNLLVLIVFAQLESYHNGLGIVTILCCNCLVV